MNVTGRVKKIIYISISVYDEEFIYHRKSSYEPYFCRVTRCHK